MTHRDHLHSTILFICLLALTVLGAINCATGETNLPDGVWPGTDWATRTPAEVGMDLGYLNQARDFALSQGGGSGQVIRYGYKVMSWGDENALYDLKSTSKSIGVSALGLALADGLIQSVDDPANSYYPAVGADPSSNNPAWLAGLTLKHLATHSGGFDKPGGYVDLYYQPGATWVYSDAGANWLGEILTYVYERDLKQLLFERLFTPMGLDQNDLVWRDNIYRDDIYKNGVYLKNREFGSGISADVDAMSRIGYLYLNQGMWNGDQLLPASFVRDVTSYQPELAGLAVPTTLPNGEQVKPAYGATDHYGMLWWTNADKTMANVPADAYWGWGLNDSLIVVIPSLGIVASRAGDPWQAGWEPNYDVIEPFIENIVRAADNANPNPALTERHYLPLMIKTNS